jgi:hypothetical protein
MFDPLVRLGFVIALAGSVATVDGCSRPDGPPTPPPPSPAQVDLDIVSTALHDCFIADCERARAHLSQLSPTSSLRGGDAYRAIVFRHDAEQLLRADMEPDPVKRRPMLLAVLESKEADPNLRSAAAERIARLGAQSLNAAREIAINASPESNAAAAAAAAAEDADLLTKSRSKDASDQSVVRAKIEPKIFSGKATPGDVAMLRTVCKAQHDDACIRQLDRLILR